MDYLVKSILDSKVLVKIGTVTKPTADAPIWAMVRNAKGAVVAYGKIETNQEMVTSHVVTVYATEKLWKKGLDAEGIDPDAKEAELSEDSIFNLENK